MASCLNCLGSVRYRELGIGCACASLIWQKARECCLEPAPISSRTRFRRRPGSRRQEIASTPRLFRRQTHRLRSSFAGLLPFSDVSRLPAHSCATAIKSLKTCDWRSACGRKISAVVSFAFTNALSLSWLLPTSPSGFAAFIPGRRSKLGNMSADSFGKDMFFASE